jgi:hypothetical protein
MNIGGGGGDSSYAPACRKDRAPTPPTMRHDRCGCTAGGNSANSSSPNRSTGSCQVRRQLHRAPASGRGVSSSGRAAGAQQTVARHRSQHAGSCFTSFAHAVRGVTAACRCARCWGEHCVRGRLHRHAMLRQQEKAAAATAVGVYLQRRLQVGSAVIHQMLVCVQTCTTPIAAVPKVSRCKRALSALECGRAHARTHDTRWTCLLARDGKCRKLKRRCASIFVHARNAAPLHECCLLHAPHKLAGKLAATVSEALKRCAPPYRSLTKLNSPSKYQLLSSVLCSCSPCKKSSICAS